MRVIDRPDMRALTPLGAMDEARAELKAYKRKAKAQRDNWKARVVKAERELADTRILLSELIDRIKGTPNKAGEGIGK